MLGRKSRVGLPGKPGERWKLIRTNTAWMYISEIVPRLGGLVVVPLWSARVNPREYGQWVLLASGMEILIQITSLGMVYFLSKVLTRYHDKRSDTYFGMGGASVIALSSFSALIMVLSSSWLSRHFVGPEARSDLFVFLGLYLILSQINSLATTYAQCRVEGPRLSFFILLRWVFSTGFLLYFLVLKNCGFYSWVWAAVAGELGPLPLSLYFLRHVVWKYFDRHLFRFALRFSLPNLGTSMLSWIHNRVGRYALSMERFGAGVGLYGVAQNFSQNYYLVLRPAKGVSIQMVIHDLENDHTSPRFLEFFHAYGALALAVAFLSALFLGDVVHWLAAPAYRTATLALPSILFALYLEEIYTLYDTLMHRYFKSWFHLWSNLATFPTMLVAVWWLVPRMGFVGAALAQLAGSIGKIGFAHIYSGRISPRAFRLKEKLCMATVALIVTAWAEFRHIAIFPKILLALAGMIPFGVYHWERRNQLFPTVWDVFRKELSARFPFQRLAK